MELRFTELALTLGNWGRAPLEPEWAQSLAGQLLRWSLRTGVALRLEVYAEQELERELLTWLLRESGGSSTFVPLVRLEPRSDRWRMLAELGITDAVFDVPVGEGFAGLRFTPDGASRAPEYAREAARGAMLAGLSPEIALTDITRAQTEIVAETVERVEEESHARGVAVRWRLVDDLGLGDPLPGGRLPRSLAAWVRTLHRDNEVELDRISVQASNRRGLALANALAGLRGGAESAASSLFGFGLGAGWAATEQVLYHAAGEEVELASLLNLRKTLLNKDVVRDSNRPISGGNAWEMLGGAAPEELEKRYDAQLGLDPLVWFGHSPLPLLTQLSGHAGMLHLMHRHYPDHHFESDDPRSLRVSEEFEAQFSAGRQTPVPWSELQPKLAAAGLFEESGSGE